MTDTTGRTVQQNDVYVDNNGIYHTYGVHEKDGPLLWSCSGGKHNITDDDFKGMTYVGPAAEHMDKLVCD